MGGTRANTLAIPHSPSSVFHLPLGARAAALRESAGLSQTLADELQRHPARPPRWRRSARSGGVGKAGPRLWASSGTHFPRRVLLVGCDLRRFWTRQAAASAQRPGSSSSSRAARPMIYFRGKDVGIQRGHIYSLFVWPEDVPVKAQNSEKKKIKACGGMKAIFSGRRRAAFTSEELPYRILKTGI